MKSNICRIENGTKDLAAILKESEKVAVYNELSPKQANQLRLLCEELDGMLPNIIEEFSGDFWIEYEQGLCKLNASIELMALTADKKEELISIAKNKTNAASEGLADKIRSAIENFFLVEEMPQSFAIANGAYHYSFGSVSAIDYSYFWSLNQYKYSVNQDEQAAEWDELEKSLIASIADDVIVGVKGNRADIVIVKNFA